MTEKSMGYPLAVIGLGAMGSALADALLNAGHAVTIWNRTPSRAEPLLERGARLANTIDDALAGNPLVIACVSNYEALGEVLGSAGDALAGCTVVNLTNGTPQEARAMAGWIGHQDARYLDGGIMAIPEMIGGPASLMLYSGSPQVYASFKGVLNPLGSGVFLGIDPGLASLHELALLSGMYGLLGGFLHSVALVGSEGVTATEFTTSLLIPWVESMTTTLPEMAAQIDARDYATSTSSLAMQAVALANISEASRSQGILPDLMLPIQALMDRRVAEGGGDDDVSALIEALRQ